MCLAATADVCTRPRRRAGAPRAGGLSGEAPRREVAARQGAHRSSPRPPRPAARRPGNPAMVRRSGLSRVGRAREPRSGHDAREPRSAQAHRWFSRPGARRAPARDIPLVLGRRGCRVPPRGIVLPCSSPPHRAARLAVAADRSSAAALAPRRTALLARLARASAAQGGRRRSGGAAERRSEGSRGRVGLLRQLRSSRRGESTGQQQQQQRAAACQRGSTVPGVGPRRGGG